MCFSATASFTSGVALAGIGLISMKKAESTPFKPISTVPLLFGVQQISEGFLWLGLQNESFAPAVPWSATIFLLFAWIVWPIFIPYTMLRLEQNRMRRILLIGAQVIGVIVAISLAYVLFFKGVAPEIKGHSIRYDVHIKTDLEGLMSILYLICTVAPPFLSGRKYLWVLGAVTGVFYLISKIYYEDHFLSVWCFFAAVGSIMILWVVHMHTRHKGISQESE